MVNMQLQIRKYGGKAAAVVGGPAEALPTAGGSIVLLHTGYLWGPGTTSSTSGLMHWQCPLTIAAYAAV